MDEDQSHMPPNTTERPVGMVRVFESVNDVTEVVFFREIFLSSASFFFNSRTQVLNGLDPEEALRAILSPYGVSMLYRHVAKKREEAEYSARWDEPVFNRVKIESNFCFKQ